MVLFLRVLGKEAVQESTGKILTNEMSSLVFKHCQVFLNDSLRLEEHKKKNDNTTRCTKLSA